MPHTSCEHSLTRKLALQNTESAWVIKIGLCSRKATQNEEILRKLLCKDTKHPKSTNVLNQTEINHCVKTLVVSRLVGNQR